jgi:hypothetical protein
MTAAAWAEQQVAAVRDDPSGRLALMQRCYYGPFGKAPRHLPYRRAAVTAMQWELRRGVLQPPFSDRPGSPWWRAVNERVLRNGCHGFWQPPPSRILQLARRLLPAERLR